jgi:PIN domain nuclease of toxin-antitoxin system
LIDEFWRTGGTICLSAVTAWEVALLVDTGRVSLDLPVKEWVERFAARPGIEVVTLTHTAAACAYQLRELQHRDPADRLLIATAIELCCPLVTYDDRIRNFAINHGQQYGFALEP